MNYRNWLVDLYRVILILWIALFHYTASYNTADPNIHINYPVVFNRGYIGVSAFFLMSGFYMNRVLNCSIGGGGNYFEYCAKRYFRLWVPYVISCLVIYLIVGAFPYFKENVSFDVFVANIFLFVHPGLEYIEGAHWFLGVLFILQLLVGSCIIIKDQHIRRKALLGLCLVFGVGHWIAFLLNIDVFNPWASALLYFLAGLQLSQLLVYKDKKFILPLIIYLLFIMANYYWYYIANVLLFFVIVNEYTERIIHIQESKLLCALGGISFCWFLVHNRIGCIIQYYLIPHDDTALYWLILPIMGTFIIACLVNTLSGMVSKKLNKKYDLLLSAISKKYFV